MARLDMRGNFVDTKETTFVTDEWEILAMKIRDNEFYHLIFWSGSINDPRLRLTTCVASENVAVVDFYNTLVFDSKWHTIYCCPSADNCEVTVKNLILQFFLFKFSFNRSFNSNMLKLSPV